MVDKGENKNKTFVHKYT